MTFKQLGDPTFVTAEIIAKLSYINYSLVKTSIVIKSETFLKYSSLSGFFIADNFNITIIQESLVALDSIEATASIIKPEIVEDVFREVYNGLMPKPVRHLLGEYYTPGG